MFCFSLQILSEILLILKRIQGDTITYYTVLQSTRYSRQILMKFEISRQIFEKYSTNFMKIRPVAVEFHADRQVGMTNVTVAFRTFTTAPKNLQ